MLAQNTSIHTNHVVRSSPSATTASSDTSPAARVFEISSVTESRLCVRAVSDCARERFLKLPLGTVTHPCESSFLISPISWSVSSSLSSSSMRFVYTWFVYT